MLDFTIINEVIFLKYRVYLFAERNGKPNLAYLYLRIMQHINAACQWSELESPVSCVSAAELVQVWGFGFLLIPIDCFTPVRILRADSTSLA